MLDVHTPVSIKYWYCLIVMMILYSLPTLDSTASPSNVSLVPTSPPTITFLSTEGSTCSDTCGAERELVNNDNVKEHILKYSNEGQKNKIRCLDTSKITNMDELLKLVRSDFNADLSCWDVSSVTSMSAMFYQASAFNNNISSWDVSSVTTMWAMFSQASAFNNNISSWDVSSVKRMVAMFHGASSFNNDLSSWDVSSVTSIWGMFLVASAFNTDLSSWDVSSVTSMDYMFYQASAFNNDLSSWDVSSVTDMSYMFSQALAFNSDITSWDVSSVKYMWSMFKNAQMFGMTLCNWNMENLLNKDEVFDGLFDGSKCDFIRCFSCTYVPSSRPSFTLLSSSPSSSSSYTPTYRNITFFPTKVSSSDSPTITKSHKRKSQVRFISRLSLFCICGSIIVWILLRINYKRNTNRRKKISAAKQTYGDPYTLNSRNASKSSGIDGRFKGITDTHSAPTNYYN